MILKNHIIYLVLNSQMMKLFQNDNKLKTKNENISEEDKFNTGYFIESSYSNIEDDVNKERKKKDYQGKRKTSKRS